MLSSPGHGSDQSTGNDGNPGSIRLRGRTAGAIPTWRKRHDRDFKEVQVHTRHFSSVRVLKAPGPNAGSGLRGAGLRRLAEDRSPSEPAWRPRRVSRRAPITTALSRGSVTTMTTYRLVSALSTRVLRVAIYARVSSQRQAKEHTISSQLDALNRHIASDGLECDQELCFVDDGFSGSSLIRPGLERLRDQAAAGAIDRLYVLSPDRLSRKYAYQVLIVEELARCGVEVIFLNNPIGKDPEENLLLQVQGMIAEYERAKIMERSRRGKQHAARRGSVSVFSGAPYGYRYISKHEGDGEARFQVVASEARVVRKIFDWVARERCSLREVRRRLRREGILSPTGKAIWTPTTIGAVLRNTAYIGSATYGKTRNQPFKRKRLRPQRGKPEHPRGAVSRANTPAQDQIRIPVPA